MKKLFLALGVITLLLIPSFVFAWNLPTTPQTNGHYIIFENTSNEIIMLSTDVLNQTIFKADNIFDSSAVFKEYRFIDNIWTYQREHFYYGLSLVKTVLFSNQNILDNNNNIYFDNSNNDYEYPIYCALPNDNSTINLTNNKLLIVSYMLNDSPFTMVDIYGYRVKMFLKSDNSIVFDEKFTCEQNTGDFIQKLFGLTDVQIKSYSRFSINGILSDYLTIPLNKLQPNSEYYIVIYNSTKIFNGVTVYTGEIITSANANTNPLMNGISNVPTREQFADGFQGDIQYGFSYLIWLITYPFQLIGGILRSLTDSLISLFTGFDVFISRFSILIAWLPAPIIALISLGFGLILIKWIFKR